MPQLSENYFRRATERVLAPIKKNLDWATPRPITSGLPAGAVLYEVPNLVIAGTPCSIPMFKKPMATVACCKAVNVIIARHGTYPEVLDPVLWDAMIWTEEGLIEFEDMILFEGRAGDLCLVPGCSGPILHRRSTGVVVDVLPTFTWEERSEGICRAAKRLVLLSRDGSY